MTQPGVGAYIKSKTIAERAARDWMAEQAAAMEFCSVNPSAVLGPLLSDDFSTSIQFVQRMMDGRCRARRGWASRWSTCATSPTCTSAR